MSWDLQKLSSVVVSHLLNFQPNIKQERNPTENGVLVQSWPIKRVQLNDSSHALKIASQPDISSRASSTSDMTFRVVICGNRCTVIQSTIVQFTTEQFQTIKTRWTKLLFLYPFGLAFLVGKYYIELCKKTLAPSSRNKNHPHREY